MYAIFKSSTWHINYRTTREHRNRHFQKSEKIKLTKTRGLCCFDFSGDFKRTGRAHLIGWPIFRTPLSWFWLVDGGLFCAIWRVRHFLKNTVNTSTDYIRLRHIVHGGLFEFWKLRGFQLIPHGLPIRAGRQERHKGRNCRKSVACRTVVWLRALKVSSVNAQASCRWVEHASLLVTILQTAFVLKKPFIYRWVLFYCCVAFQMEQPC